MISTPFLANAYNWHYIVLNSFNFSIRNQLPVANRAADTIGMVQKFKETSIETISYGIERDFSVEHRLFNWLLFTFYVI